MLDKIGQSEDGDCKLVSSINRSLTKDSNILLICCVGVSEKEF
jgi:hypothetical protein